MAKHVRMRLGYLSTTSFGEPPQAPGSRVAVHPGAAAVEQDGPEGAGTDGPADSSPDGWRERDQDDLGAFAAHAQHPVAVLFALVGDVRAGRLEDPQAEQPEHRNECEVAVAAGLAGGGEQGLELQMRESQGWRFGRDRGAADVLGW